MNVRGGYSFDNYHSFSFTLKKVILSWMELAACVRSCVRVNMCASHKYTHNQILIATRLGEEEENNRRCHMKHSARL